MTGNTRETKYDSSMEKLIQVSFLSAEMKEEYGELLLKRYDRIVK